MDDIDLDIQHYDYDELLGIFHIHTKHSPLMESLYKVQERVNFIKNTMQEPVYLFFFKAQVIIEAIHKLFEKDVIQLPVHNMNDKNKLEQYVAKIKKIEHFENYNVQTLIEKLEPTLINKKKQSSSNPDVPPNPRDVLDNPLNEKYHNVHTVHPVNINGKNMTNQVVNTQVNAVGPGFLNSIKRVTQLQNLNLNSCFRTNYYQSSPCDFLYPIPSEIKNVVSMKLASIEIPNAWYLFSQLQKNNHFTIVIIKKEPQDSKDSKTAFLITIPDGNYDSDTLTHYLNTTYFYESATETDLKYIKFSIDPHNFKTKFEIVETFELIELRFSLLFLEDINQNMMNTMGWMIGFRMPKYYDIQKQICSEGLFDAGGDRYIYVSINDYQYNNNNLNIIGFDKSMLNEDVIAKIPMVNGKLSLIIDSGNDLVKKRTYNGPVNLSRLHVKIMDKFGTTIDLNHMDFSLTLELEILYESFNFTNVAK